MKIYNRLHDKFKFILKATIFLYLVFSFYEWSFNPGQWDTLSRVGIIFAFKILSQEEISFIKENTDKIKLIIDNKDGRIYEFNKFKEYKEANVVHH
jgi:hypothetical protein